MVRSLTTILLILAATLALPGSVESHHATAIVDEGSEPDPLTALGEASPTPGGVVVVATLEDGDADAVAWATARYSEAGLSLPAIRVSFHANTEACQGSRGGHRLQNGRSRVFICIPERGPTREFQIKRVLLHEFAHAWDHGSVTDETRSEFMVFKDLRGWLFEVPYEERAAEDAAEIITWGLMDRPIRLGRLVGSWSWDERLEGYRILTGGEPPHGYVWSLWAASHDVYAHTPSQVEAVRKAWERSHHRGRLTERIEVRFQNDKQSCIAEVLSSELTDGRLRVQVCAGPQTKLSEALFDTFTGGQADPSPIDTMRES